MDVQLTTAEAKTRLKALRKGLTAYLRALEHRVGEGEVGNLDSFLWAGLTVFINKGLAAEDDVDVFLTAAETFHRRIVKRLAEVELNARV